jgi:microcystin-dependent protein
MQIFNYILVSYIYNTMSGDIIDAETVFFTTPNPSLIGPLPDSIDIREGTFAVLNATTLNVVGAVPPTSGGTGQTTYAIGDILYASAPNILSKLPIGAPTDVLAVGAGVPTWAPTTGGIPVGTLLDFAGTVAPAGYLVCDGASIDTTTYAALFAVIGYAYGGAGANFNVPDFRGRFVRTADNMGTGAAGRDLGARDATLAQTQSTAANGIATATNGVQHTHNVITPGGVVTGTGAGAFGLSSASIVINCSIVGILPTGADIPLHSHALVDPVGAETRPINVQCYKIIKF